MDKIAHINSNEEQPLLSICIPIYNRLPFLERMLARFIEDRDLFESEIELIVSDNCSEDDLASCVKKYQSQGLRLTYHRQARNVGADGNFKTLFGMATGKYCWLLGSDDIPVQGFIPELVNALSDTDYGLFHVKSYKVTENGKTTIFENNSQNLLLEAISYNITFMSANIYRTEIVSKVNFNKYEKTNLIQVPVYLESCFSYANNAIFEYKFIEKGTDGANNGGYNFIRVFVENLFSILSSYVERGLLSKKSFNRIKRTEYVNYLLEYFVGFILCRGSVHYKTEDKFKIMWKHYGRYPYAYYYLAKYLCNFTGSYLKRKL